MRPRPSVVLPLALVALSALAFAPSCGEERAAPLLERAQRPIVNGQIETGWPGVGALTMLHPSYGYLGAFCSGTLIAPDWVVTAAHCLVEKDGFEPQPDSVLFYLGGDANPTVGGWPETGALYEVSELWPHPDYDPYTNENDIGLVHLAETADGVPVTSANLASIGDELVEQAVLFVGFGVTDGLAGDGSGIKRSTSLTLIEAGPTWFATDYRGSNVCYGDSGGPGLYEFDGEWRVIGVVSGGTEESCLGGTDFHTRVDAFRDWILAHLGGEVPSCQDYPGLCGCADACLDDGTCDDSVCRDYSCDAVYDCAVGCSDGDSDCQAACRARGTDDARAAFDAMVSCFDERCWSAIDFQQCAYQECGAEIDGCFSGGPGALDCESSYDCMVDCSSGSQSCVDGCYQRATASGQQRLSEMLGCFQEQCGSTADATAWRACVWDRCHDTVRACIVPDDCDLRGGDCTADEACRVAPDEETDCVTSLGGRPGEACDPGTEGARPCADGLACAARDGGVPTCEPVCLEDGDCEGGRCDAGALADIVGAGLCVAVVTPPDPDAGSTDPDAGSTDPDAAPTGPDAGSTEPDAAPVGPDVDPGSPDAGAPAPDLGGPLRPDAGVDPAGPDAGSGGETAPNPSGDPAYRGGAGAPDDSDGQGGEGSSGGCTAGAGGRAAGAPLALLALLLALPFVIRRRRA